MQDPDLDRLKPLLERLVGYGSRPPLDIAELAFAMKDCRLQLVFRQVTLTEEQLHCLDQLEGRLQGASRGQLAWYPVPGMAVRAIELFGWGQRQPS